MRHILFLAIIVILSSGKTNKTESNKNIVKQDSLDSKVSDKEVPTLKKESNITKGYIIAYSDSIPILDRPSEDSDTIGYLEELKMLERYNYYFSWIGATKSIYSAKWFAVKYKNDTAWIDRAENISLELDIDTIGSLQYRNKVNIMEICGVCYVGTQVWSLKTKKLILKENIQKEKSSQLNDSLYLLFGNKLRIYNDVSDTIIYETKGDAICISPKSYQVYFLRFERDSIISKYEVLNIDIPCSLVKYDWKTKNETTLFIENDIQKRPYVWGPDYRYTNSLTKTDTSDNLFLFFELYTMNPNPKDEADYTIFRYKIDTIGNVIME